MIKPNGARVVVEPIKEEDLRKTPSGLIVPVKSVSIDDKFIRGKVIAVGEGRLTDQNIRIPTPFKEGDVVWYNKFNAAEIPDDEGGSYYIVDEFNVLATEV